jgi:hypothetical protein
MKRKYWRLIIIGLIVFLPLLVIGIVLINLKIDGFRSAFEELLVKETKGRYYLKIENSSIQLRTLRFQFENVQIHRSDTAPSVGVRSVVIPDLFIRLGSVKDFLQSKQLDIHQLELDEPIIITDPKPSDKQKVGAPLSITDQLLNIYPAIETTLRNFKIESFAINKASIDIKQPDKQGQQVSLIDLIIQDWDMRNLTEKSQLQIKVGGQSMEFPKASFNFSQIEYNLKNHFLRFQDFVVKSTDSVSASRFEMGGKMLSLEGLNYKELYEHQHYILKNALIEEPYFNAVINTNKKESNKSAVQKGALVREFIKKTVLGGSIDSITVDNAKVNIRIKSSTDSTFVNLSQVDFKIFDFQLSSENDIVKIGGYQFNIGTTELNLKGEYDILVKDLFYGFGTARAKDFSVSNSTNKRPLAHLKEIHFMDWIPEQIFLENRLKIGSVRIENGESNLNDGLLKSKKQTSKSSMLIDIESINLKDFNINYQNSNQNASIKNLSLDLRKIKSDGENPLNLKIHSLAFNESNFTDRQKKLNSSIQNLVYQNSKVLVQNLKVINNGITIQGSKLSATQNEALNIIKNPTQWETVSFNRLVVKGTLPGHPSLKRNTSANQNLKLEVKQLSVKEGNTLLTRGKQKISFFISQLKVNDINYTGKSDINFNEITGKMLLINLSNPKLEATINSISLDYPSTIDIKGIKLKRDSLNSNVSDLLIKNIQRTEHGWLIGRLVPKAINVYQGKYLSVLSDSVALTNLNFSENKIRSVGGIYFYSPLVTFNKRSGTNKDGQTNKDSNKEISLDIIKEISLIQAKVKLPNQDEIDIESINAQPLQKKISLSGVNYETEKTKLKANQITWDKNVVDIDNLNYKNSPIFIDGVQHEKEEIDATIKDISINGIGLSSSYQLMKPDNLSVFVGDFDVLIHKDKRLPDLPLVKKPGSLYQMVAFPKIINLNSITIQKGSLHYSEYSDVTGEKGELNFGEMNFRINLRESGGGWRIFDMTGNTKLYDQYPASLEYHTLDSSRFEFEVDVKTLDLQALNSMVVPLQAMKIKSGYLDNLSVSFVANDERAEGNSSITYKDLHLEIYKKGEPEKKNLGSELITLIADGIVLKHSKENSNASFTQDRLQHKSVFNYWAKSILHGAMAGIRKGKNESEKRANKKSLKK